MNRTVTKLIRWKNMGNQYGTLAFISIVKQAANSKTCSTKRIREVIIKLNKPFSLAQVLSSSFVRLKKIIKTGYMSL